MNMLQNVITATRENLLDLTAAKHPQGFRFVTMTCTDLGEAHDLIYSFEKNQELYNLRLELPKGQELPSISMIFFAAAVVENEIKDLFGIPVRGLVIDYEGRFLLSEGAPRAPLNKTAAADKAGEKKEGRENG